MKRVFLLISLMAVQAHADSNFICTGVDEAPGFVTVNAGREQAGRVFGHVQGAELRLLEDGGMLSLTIKKSDSEVISVVANAATGILFSQGAVSVNCVKQK